MRFGVDLYGCPTTVVVKYVMVRCSSIIAASVLFCVPSVKDSFTVTGLWMMRHVCVAKLLLYYTGFMSCMLLRIIQLKLGAFGFGHFATVVRGRRQIYLQYAHAPHKPVKAYIGLCTYLLRSRANKTGFD